MLVLVSGGKDARHRIDSLATYDPLAMTRDEFRRLHQRRPFHPFRLHLADGRSLDVPHPERLALRSDGRTAHLIGPRTDEYFDIMLVTSIEVATEPMFDLFADDAPGERAA